MARRTAKTETTRQTRILKKFKPLETKTESWISPTNKKGKTPIIFVKESSDDNLEHKQSEQTSSTTYFAFDSHLANGSLAKIYRADYKVTVAEDGKAQVDKIDAPKAIKLFNPLEKIGQQQQTDAIENELTLLKVYHEYDWHMKIEFPHGKEKRIGILYDYIEGQTLTKVLQNPSHSFHDRVTMANRLLEEYNNFISERHIVHGDIKPDNIIRCDNGDFVFIDFGTGGTKSKSSSEHPGAATYILGTTPDYEAPEVLSARQKDPFRFEIGTLDTDGQNNERLAAPDVYSLGIVLDQLFFTPTSNNDCEAKDSNCHTAAQGLISKMTEPHPEARILISEAITSLETIKAQLEEKQPSSRKLSTEEANTKPKEPSTKEDHLAPTPKAQALPSEKEAKTEQNEPFTEPKKEDPVSSAPIPKKQSLPTEMSLFSKPSAHNKIIFLQAAATLVALAACFTTLALLCPPSVFIMGATLLNGAELAMMITGSVVGSTLVGTGAGAAAHHCLSR